MMLVLPPLLRLARTPRAWISIALWIVLSLVLALIVRGADSEKPTDRMLLELFAPIVLPFLVLSVLGGTAGATGITSFARRAQFFGVGGGRAAAACVIAGAAASAVLAAIVAALGVVLVHGRGDPSLARDLATTVWVSALGAAAYSAYFSLGSTFCPSGSGWSIFLVASYMLAGAGTAGAALSPHAHIRSLLGGAHAGDLTQRASSAALCILFVVSLALCAWRCRKRTL